MAQDHAVTFPQDPRARVDEALGDLVARASDVLATQGRLRALLRANQLISEQLELPVVLRRIVETAIDLVKAEYGALGVIAPNGTLEQFIHVGMSEDEVARIGHLPEGHGLLGALVADPRPIRLPHLADDERSSGLPSHHPQMDSFLGVPILIGSRVFGNLYLTNAAAGEFSLDDEELVTALAATAGFAIDNARSFESAKRRQAWLAASAELTVGLAGSAEDPLDLVVERVQAVSGADVVRFLVPTADAETMVVTRAKGHNEKSIVGLRVPVKGTVSGRVLQTRKPLLMDEDNVPAATRALGLGPTMAVPMSTAGKFTGVLTVSRLPGRGAFLPEDLEMVADLAGRVGIASELSSGRDAQKHLAVMEERGRIARDLHDHVIQQLFATGLELQSVVGILPDGVSAARVEQAITRIDEAIGQIRTAVFALSPKEGQATVRHRIIDLVAELGSSLAQKPWVSFEGPVDLVVVGDLAEDVAAVVREALTNVAKHATAGKVTLVVAVRDSSIEIDVQNDGAGRQNLRMSGLSNLQRRATERGGTATFSTQNGNAAFLWRVPIGGDQDR